MVKARREERSEWVKGKNVVYIYHNMIDEASHTADTAVFPACEGAIQQIKNLVGMIVNNFGGTNIVITADHGFLYTYSPLDEASGYGRNFARSGGVAKAVVQTLEEKGSNFEVKAVPCSGTAAWRATSSRAWPARAAAFRAPAV